jgi:aldose 1-epimerase
VRPVEGTDFDFRSMRAVRWEHDGEQVLYDHNFCLSMERVALRRIARAAAAPSGIRFELWSTEAGVQFYDGHKVSVPVPGLGGIGYGSRSGFALESQVWPDAANEPSFPSAVLRPSERYRQVSEDHFARS